MLNLPFVRRPCPSWIRTTRGDFCATDRASNQTGKIPEEIPLKVLLFTDGSPVSYRGKDQIGGMKRWEVLVFIGQNGEWIHVDAETKEVSLVIHELSNIPVQ